MNLSKQLGLGSKLLHSLILKWRSYLPRQRCQVFVDPSASLQDGIGPIFVINLDRQPDRWVDIVRELDRILDAGGQPLSERVIRFSACDAQSDQPDFLNKAEVGSSYTLGDQLFVEPQPFARPDIFDLERPIQMSQAEIAVAHSHIGVWRKIAQSSAAYSLVLEDDVWFRRSFVRMLERAWLELGDKFCSTPRFDILYVSYDEVRFGTPKEFVSKHVFRPERGLWFLSGYVLSKEGAQTLLDLLPSQGPIDLWINHKFQELKVRALRHSVVEQRSDLYSTNSYSILPMLSRIGVIDSGEAALFHHRPSYAPVFAFGNPGAGLSSLAMALSMLGYRCCSDFESIPEPELEDLLAGQSSRVFDAYVNIGSLELKIREIVDRYPGGKYIFLGDEAIAASTPNCNILKALEGVDLLHLEPEQGANWRSLCEHLKLAPPNAPYPIIREIGRRCYQLKQASAVTVTSAKRLRCDTSPWIASLHPDWSGINTHLTNWQKIFPTLDTATTQPVCFVEDFIHIQPTRWALRTDTFPGNLGLFRPSNISLNSDGGLSLTVAREPLGVREFSAAALTCREKFLFGRFEATIKATNVPGLVTGFFLHRDSPRQEIDIEILGNRPDELLVNVFYNPGTDGAKFDYGYRGTPAVIKLGFDASREFHRFAIEWDPHEIRWFVDQILVHRRAIWEPTPIPHLPMALHINTWPSKSQEFAGRLAINRLPASAMVRSVIVNANQVYASPSRKALIKLDEQPLIEH